MSRNIQFPPLNKRFTSGVMPEDIKIINGRDKPDDKYDRFREDIGANNRVPKLVSQKRGLYNPTDIKRPAGIPGELKPRVAYLFKDDKSRAMDDLSGLVGQKGLTGLASLFGDIEILDPSDSVWIDERNRIIAEQTALGKRPKQIESYLEVNKPLGREQHKVKRKEAIISPMASKGEQLAVIKKAIDDGLSATLAGQTAITAEVINLLGKFGSQLDASEQKRLIDAMNTIRPGITWKEAPFNGIRFVKPDEFNQTNPKLGFILALILQNSAKKAGATHFVGISKDMLTNGMSHVDSLQQLFLNMARLNPTNPNRLEYASGPLQNRPIDGLFDLEDNYIKSVEEAKNDVGDPVLFLRLTGSTTTDKLIADIDRKEEADLNGMEQQFKNWVATNSAKTKQTIDDLVSPNGYKMATIDASYNKVDKDRIDLENKIDAIKKSAAYISAKKNDKTKMIKADETKLKSVNAKLQIILDYKNQLQKDAGILSNRYQKAFDIEKEKYDDAVVRLKERNRAERDRLIRFVRSYIP